MRDGSLCGKSPSAAHTKFHEALDADFFSVHCALCLVQGRLVSWQDLHKGHLKHLTHHRVLNKYQVARARAVLFAPWKKGEEFPLFLPGVDLGLPPAVLFNLPLRDHDPTDHAAMLARYSAFARARGITEHVNPQDLFKFVEHMNAGGTINDIEGFFPNHGLRVAVITTPSDALASVVERRAVRVRG
jgi:hypothetical protein